MRDEGDSCVKPHAPWTLEKEKKKRVCRFLAKTRFPDGFCSNWERCVDMEGGKVQIGRASCRERVSSPV